VSEPAAAGAPQEKAQGPFLAISSDLCGLVISSWLVPTVRRPFKGVFTFVAALLTQCCILMYMGAAIYTSSSKSTCDTPALLQAVGLYVFIAACVHELESIHALQCALVTSRLRIPASPAVDNLGRLMPGTDVILDVRPTSRRARALLALVPLAELAVELATLAIGALYLCFSESTEELILNAVAVNFITQIDDLMLQAFVHKASRERLNKYQFECWWGIEDGDTQLKKASAGSRKLASAQERLPLLTLLLAVAMVAAGQAYGRFARGEQGCSWVFAGTA
jgi:hypothetical protein